MGRREWIDIPDEGWVCPRSCTVICGHFVLSKEGVSVVNGKMLVEWIDEETPCRPTLIYRAIVYGSVIVAMTAAAIIWSIT